MENKLGILDSKKSPDLDVRLDEVNEVNYHILLNSLISQSGKGVLVCVADNF